jgi:hypothetical protein
MTDLIQDEKRAQGKSNKTLASFSSGRGWTRIFHLSRGVHND